ncbi:MAG: UvrD-helicase domain-containing protein, partial [Oscillospiraceae bacterium]|nr:UvrD-helicase domain-containing protein [Oscillospiraceae bacterium]
QLSDSMAERNISVSPENPFELCFRKGSETALATAIGNEKYMQLFRMEAYVLPEGEYPKMRVINGKMTDPEKAELLAIQNRQVELLADGTDCGVYSFEQYAAEHGQSGYHTAVRAGAGTGKTYLLTAKVSYLLYCCSRAGITSLPEQIVMLTFTNEAADNMRKRIKGMLFSFFVLTGNPIFTRCIEELSGMQICTIDAFC